MMSDLGRASQAANVLSEAVGRYYGASLHAGNLALEVAIGRECVWRTHFIVGEVAQQVQAALSVGEGRGGARVVGVSCDCIIHVFGHCR